MSEKIKSETYPEIYYMKDNNKYVYYCEFRYLG